jgi:membrane protein
MRSTGLLSALRRTLREFREDNLADWAAALTYYGLLSLFPALIALASIVGLVADPESTTEKLSEIVTEIGPDSAADTFSGPIESLTSNRSAAGVLFVAGLALALWSASGYVGAFIRASNIVYEVPEGRPFWKLRPLQLLVTLTMVIVVALLALALVLTGPVAEAVGEPLGISDTAVTAWDIAKWPVILLIATGMIAILYYASPNARLRGFRWVTPGSVVAVVAWLVASGAFAVYVANFGAYDATYGTLGGVVAMLVWMWISNLALLFGHQLNAELERGRQLTEGKRQAETEIQLEPRTPPKAPSTS